MDQSNKDIINVYDSNSVPQNQSKMLQGTDGMVIGKNSLSPSPSQNLQLQ